MKFLNTYIIVLLIIFICSATDVFAVQSGAFPKDPRGGSLPAGVRLNTSANINPDALQAEPSQNFLPEDFSGTSSPNNLNSNNKESPKKISLTTFVVWPLIIIIFFVVFFLALIFLVIRSIYAENKN